MSATASTAIAEAEPPVTDDLNPRTITPALARKKKSVAGIQFRSTDDIRKRFPFPEELETEDGLYLWHGRIVTPRPWVADILQKEFDDLPSSIGRIKFFAYI